MVSLEDLVALITRGPPPGSQSRPEFNEYDEKDEVGDADPTLAGSGAANPGSEPQSGAEAPQAPSHDAGVRVAPGPQASSWFRARPATEGDDEENTRLLPANVRWVLLFLLDSLFFTVKEPIEGLDRHPVVHALLEYLLTVSCAWGCDEYLFVFALFFMSLDFAVRHALTTSREFGVNGCVIKGRMAFECFHGGR